MFDIRLLLLLLNPSNKGSPGDEREISEWILFLLVWIEIIDGRETVLYGVSNHLFSKRVVDEVWSVRELLTEHEEAVTEIVIDPRLLKTILLGIHRFETILRHLYVKALLIDVVVYDPLGPLRWFHVVY